MMLNFTALSTHGKSKIEPSGWCVESPAEYKQTHLYVGEQAEERTGGGGGAQFNRQSLLKNPRSAIVSLDQYGWGLIWNIFMKTDLGPNNL